jgi:hypothetical protein
LKTFIALAGPFATIVASIAAGFIAVRLGKSQVSVARLQANTANDRLVLDLFDRRLAIYYGAKEIVGAAVRHGTSTTEEQFSFLRAINGASFLFGKEVTDYLDEIYKALVELQYCEDELKRVEERDKIKAFKRKQKQFDKIKDFYTDAEPLFAPYLHAHQKFGKQIN